MHAVIRRYQVEAADAAIANEKIQQFLVPKLKTVPGFVAYYWVDGGAGSGASLTVFQDQKGTEESVRLAAEFVREHMTDIKVSSPEIFEGMVAAHG